MGKKRSTAKVIKGDGKIPAPSRSNQKYPWSDMKVGDHVVVDNRSKASYAANATKFCQRRKLRYQFESRTVAGQVRIYRTK